MSDIKIITEPSVYLVASQERRHPGLPDFLADHGIEWDSDAKSDSDMIPELAGRLCYMSFASPRPGGNAAYLAHILEAGHGSVLEHAVFSFVITGVSRSFTHELVRHRVGFSYSQLSQRYVDESDVAFVVPPALLESYTRWKEFAAAKAGGATWDQISPVAARKAHIWLDSVSRAAAAYVHLVAELAQDFCYLDKTSARKAAREAARSVLPNCTETKIFVTANARALRHFFEIRTDPPADAEMRRAALAIYRVVAPAAPGIFGDYIAAGGAVVTANRKV